MGSGIEQMQKEMAKLTGDIIQEGIVDKQFKIIKEMQNIEPGYLSDFASTYFDDSEMDLQEFRRLIAEDTKDLREVVRLLVKLKGSSSSFGFGRVTIACEMLFKCLPELRKEEFRDRLQNVKEEISFVKEKLKPLLMLDQGIYIKPVGGALLLRVIIRNELVEKKAVIFILLGCFLSSFFYEN